VDVGGGQGALLTAMLTAHPQVRGILFDQPHVVEAAKPHITTAGLAPRCELVSGDFFASVPAGGDAYTLSEILHDWDDPQATVILRNIRKAMPQHGKVLRGCLRRLTRCQSPQHQANHSDVNHRFTARG